MTYIAFVIGVVSGAAVASILWSKYLDSCVKDSLGDASLIRDLQKACEMADDRSRAFGRTIDELRNEIKANETALAEQDAKYKPLVDAAVSMIAIVEKLPHIRMMEVTKS